MSTEENESTTLHHQALTRSRATFSVADAAVITAWRQSAIAGAAQDSGVLSFLNSSLDSLPDQSGNGMRPEGPFRAEEAN